MLLAVAAAAGGIALGGCSAGGKQTSVPSEAAMEGEAAFEDRAADALRRRGHRVERSSGGVVRSRPRPVPAVVEPWRGGPRIPGGGGVALRFAATLGEVREVAALRKPAGSAVEAEVWLERARRPSRRLVVRAGGSVFADASEVGAFDDRGSAIGTQAKAPAFEQPIAGAEPGRGVGGDDPLFPAPALVTPPADGEAEVPAGTGLRWERWKRLPAAEADLLDALDPPHR